MAPRATPRTWVDRQLAVARAWGIDRVLAAVVATAPLLMVSGPVGVPGRLGTVSLVWPLAPAVAAMAVPAGARAGFGWLETTSRRRPASLRAALAGLTFAAVVALQAILVAVVHLLSADAGVSTAVLTRNWALLAGVALAGAGPGAAPAAWLGVAAVTSVTFFLGSAPPGFPIPGWAVLLARPGNTTAELVAGACLAAGAVIYVTGGPARVVALSRRSTGGPG